MELLKSIWDYAFVYLVNSDLVFTLNFLLRFCPSLLSAGANSLLAHSFVVKALSNMCYEKSSAFSLRVWVRYPIFQLAIPSFLKSARTTTPHLCVALMLVEVTPTHPNHI